MVILRSHRNRSGAPHQPGSGLVTLMGATAIGSAGLAAGGTAGPLVAASLRVPIGAPVIAVMAGSAVTVSVVGNRRNYRQALTAGYILGAGGAAGALATTAAALPWCFVAANAFLGAATTAVFFARYAAADIARADQRGQALGAVLFAAAVGAIGGPLLLAPSGVAARGVGLPSHTGLYLVAVVAFPLAGVLLAGLTTPVTLPAHEPAPRASSVRTLWRRVGAYLALATANGAMVTVMTTAPVTLDRSDTTGGAIGVIVAVHVSGMFAPAPFAGWLCDRVGSWWVISFAGVLYAVCSGGLVLAEPTSVTIVTASLVALGLGWNFAIVGASTALAATGGATRRRREVTGEVLLAAGAAVGAATAGTFALQHGLHAASIVVGLVAGLLLLGGLARAGAVAGTRHRGPQHGSEGVPPTERRERDDRLQHERA
jgi:hypothetical protein